MADCETVKKQTIDAFNAIGISPTINPEFYNCDKDIQDTQIPDETETQQQYQTSEAGQEIGGLKRQLQAGIKHEFLTPFDNSHDSYGYVEGFLYFGNTIQTREYFKENYKLRRGRRTVLQ